MRLGPSWFDPAATSRGAGGSLGPRRSRGPGILRSWSPKPLPSGAHHSERLLPSDAEERLALARRLVAERCLYGVDVNPMAVEMAKLSLWLITLHKHRPFTFLDHAIKCGDSLLGLHSAEQIESFHLLPARATERLHDYIKRECLELLEVARTKREQIERFTVLDMRDAEFKARLHREAESALESVRAWLTSWLARGSRPPAVLPRAVSICLMRSWRNCCSMWVEPWCQCPGPISSRAAKLFGPCGRRPMQC